jgi:hypothetical protein
VQKEKKEFCWGGQYEIYKYALRFEMATSTYHCIDMKAGSSAEPESGPTFPKSIKAF